MHPKNKITVCGGDPKDDHDSVDEVLSRGAAVFLPAESGEDEEDGQPDDQLVAREHIERAQQQRNETDPVGLVAELVSLDASLSWMLYPLII